MSKKNFKELIRVLKLEKEKNHPGKIDTVWISSECLQEINFSQKTPWPGLGFELLKGGKVRVTDGGDILCPIESVSLPIDSIVADIEKNYGPFSVE